MTDFIDPYDNVEKRPHPAKFSDVILEHVSTILPDHIDTIVDPMAGVGKVVNLGPDYKYLLNELEPEWANQIDDMYDVTVGDAKDMTIPSDINTAIVTSPPYGNRMADFFKSQTRPESMKGRYGGDLGRRLTEGSTASKKFGDEYRVMMSEIYTALTDQMCSGQLFILNVSNFIRSYKEVNVVGFYLDLFTTMGFTLDALYPVVTPRRGGTGANQDLRVDHEVIMLWRKL